MDAPPDDFGDPCDYDADYDCTHCGGEGWQESDDPMWDQSDIIACVACNGTGLRKHQWLF